MLEVLDPGLLVLLVPIAWVVTASQWLLRALVLLLVAYALLAYARKLDLRDGRVDSPGLSKTYFVVRALLEIIVAILEMAPVKPPFVGGWQRLRAALKAPHPDDVRSA